MTHGEGVTGGLNPMEQDVNDATAEQARAWVRLLLSGAATQEDALALKRWRGEDVRHDAAFVREGRLFKLARQAAEELRTEAAARPRRAGLDRRALVGGALAASAAGVAVLAGRDQFGRVMAPSADFTTGKGETRRVDLADGVSVELNTLTRIALRPEAGQGAFELLTGEALVEVGMRGQVLAVMAEGGQTRTNGGRLAFRCLNGSVRVSCLEGTAQVRLSGRSADLSAHHSLSYGQGRLQSVVASDPGAEASWRQGLLVFRDRRLGDVVEEINRYREGRIIIANPQLRGRRVNGAFHTDRIDQVIDQIRLAYGVNATRLPGEVVLLA